MSTTTARPKAAMLTRPCCSCKAAEAMEMFPRCRPCHRREWRAAYSGEVYTNLRRVIALAEELEALTEDLIAEMTDPGFARTRLARFMGEDDVWHALRDLRALNYVANVGRTYEGCMYGDPADR